MFRRLGQTVKCQLVPDCGNFTQKYHRSQMLDTRHCTRYWATPIFYFRSAMKWGKSWRAEQVTDNHQTDDYLSLVIYHLTRITYHDNCYLLPNNETEPKTRTLDFRISDFLCTNRALYCYITGLFVNRCINVLEPRTLCLESEHYAHKITYLIIYKYYIYIYC